MNFEVFAVFDSKAKAFLTPFFLINVAVAKRMFSEAANENSHAYWRHPEDYSLHHLGTFDDTTGGVDCFPTPQNLGLAATYRRPSE